MKHLRLFIFFTLLLAPNTWYIQATSVKTYSEEEVFDEIKKFLIDNFQSSNLIENPESSDKPNLTAFLQDHETRLKQINLQHKKKKITPINLYDFLNEIKNKTNRKKTLEKLKVRDFQGFLANNKIYGFLVENNITIVVQAIKQIKETNSKPISTKQDTDNSVDNYEQHNKKIFPFTRQTTQDTNLASIAKSSLLTRHVLDTTTEIDENDVDSGDDNSSEALMMYHSSDDDINNDEEEEPMDSNDKIKEVNDDIGSMNDSVLVKSKVDNSHHDSSQNNIPLFDDNNEEPLHSNDKTKEVNDDIGSIDDSVLVKSKVDNSHHDSSQNNIPLIDDDNEEPLHSNDKNENTSSSNDNDVPDEPTQGNSNGDSSQNNIPLFDDNNEEPLHSNDKTKEVNDDIGSMDDSVLAKSKVDNSHHDSSQGNIPLIDDDNEESLHSNDKDENINPSNDNDVPDEPTQGNSNGDSSQGNISLFVDDNEDPLHSNDQNENINPSNDNDVPHEPTRGNLNDDSSQGNISLFVDDNEEPLHSNDQNENINSSNDNDVPDEPTRGNSNDGSSQGNIKLFDDIELEPLHSHTKTMNKDKYDVDSDLDDNNEGFSTKGYLDNDRNEMDENVNNSYHSQHSVDNSISIIPFKQRNINDIDFSYNDFDNDQDNVSTSSHYNFINTSNMHNNKFNPYKSSRVGINQRNIRIFFSYKGKLKDTSIDIAYYNVDKEANIAIEEFFKDHKINDLEPSKYTLVSNENNEVGQLNNLEDLKSKTEKECYIILKSNAWIGESWKTFKSFYHNSISNPENEVQYRQDTIDTNVTLHGFFNNKEYTLEVDYMDYNNEDEIIQTFFRYKDIKNINPFHYTIVTESAFGGVVHITKNNLSDEKDLYILHKEGYLKAWSRESWSTFINDWNDRIKKSTDNRYDVSTQYTLDTSLLHNDNNTNNNSISTISIRSISPMANPNIINGYAVPTVPPMRLYNKQQKSFTIHFEKASENFVLDNSFNTEYDIINAFFKDKRIRNKNATNYKLINNLFGEVCYTGEGIDNIGRDEDWYIVPKNICIEAESWYKQVQPYLDRFKHNRLEAPILDLERLNNNRNIGFIDNVHSHYDNDNRFKQPDQSRESVDLGREEGIVIDDIAMDDTEEDIDNPPLQSHKSSFISVGVVFCSVFYLIKKCTSKSQPVLSPQTENTMDLVVRCASEEVK